MLMHACWQLAAEPTHLAHSSFEQLQHAPGEVLPGLAQEPADPALAAWHAEVHVEPAGVQPAQPPPDGASPLG